MQDPQRVTLENLAVGNHDTGVPMHNAIDILQTSTGKPSFVVYDNVSVFGMYQKQPFRKGFWLRGLGKDSIVLMPHVQGNLHFVDSARATILVSNSYEGSVVVEGKDKRRDGMLGFLTHLGTICTHALYVKDNHSLVASDFYIEQSDNGYSLAGSADDPPGRITLQGPKLHLSPGAKGNLPFEIRDYRGQVVLGPVQYYLEPTTMRVVHRGTRPLEIFLLAGCFYQCTLEVQKDAAAQAFLIGNIRVSGKLDGHQVDDSMQGDTLSKLAETLDDLRALGEVDLRLNHR